MFFDAITTGIDFGTDQIKLLQTRQARGGAELVRAVVAPNPGQDLSASSGQKLFDLLRGLLAATGVRSKKVVLSISAPAYALHRVDLPHLDRNQMEKAVRCNLAGLVPFPIDDAALDFRTIEASAQSSHGKALEGVVTVAVSRKTLDFHLETLRELNLEPVRVEVPPLALIDSYLSGPSPVDGETVALVDVGHEGTGVTLLTGSIFRMHRYVAMGGHHLTEFLAAEARVDPRTAAARKHTLQSTEALATPLEQLARRIERVFQFFEDHNPTEKVDRILIAGGTAALPGVDRYLSTALGNPVEVLAPCGRRRVPEGHADIDTLTQHGPALTVAWGLVV